MLGIEEIVKKYQIRLAMVGGERKIEVDSSISRVPADLYYVKAHKQEIIQFLEAERARKIAEEEAKNREKYAALIEKLPVREIKNTPDETKFQELMGKIDHRHFTGAESDGLNLSIRAKNSRIRQEAQKFCSHELQTKYEYGYTQDARMRVIRTISCPKCHLCIQDEVSEPIENMWN